MKVLPSEIGRLLSGERRGVGAALLRIGLAAAELPYTAAVALRNAAFDRGWRAVHAADVPVVSVGNLTTGGTGKTPLVLWLARYFRQHHTRAALISRGYKAHQGARNDEALELECRLPDVPHLQNPDRVAAAKVAVEELESQLLILDDGFQHRRLRRDLDLVLVDAIHPFGFGHLLPRGLLRESLRGLRRASAVVLTRSDAVSESRRREIVEQIRRYAPLCPVAEVAHRPTQLVDCRQGSRSLDWIQGRRVAAFCGIGNPAGFRHTLESCGAQPIPWKEFPDHHDYQRADVESLAEWSAAADVEAAVCTAKDLVKIGTLELGGRPLFAVEVGIEFLSGQSQLEDLLHKLIPSD